MSVRSVVVLTVLTFSTTAHAGGVADPAPPGAPTGTVAPGPAESSSFRLAAQTEAAFGLSNPSFYNHLLGGRLDYVLPQGFALGGYLGYANLKGKEGRASNVLAYAMLEYAHPWSKDSNVRIPFRFATGYLPRNGNVLKLSVGISFPIGQTTRVSFDVLAPTWWIVRNRTLVSLDLGAEVTFAL